MISSCLLGIMLREWTGKVRYAPEGASSVFSMSRVRGQGRVNFRKNVRNHCKSGADVFLHKSVINLPRFTTSGFLLFSVTILPQHAIFVNMQRLFCAKLSERAGLQNISLDIIFLLRT